MDEKLKKIIIYVSAGFVLLFIILFLISSCQGKRMTYDKYVTKMESVAKAYFESHEDELPTEDKKTSEYTLKEMIENKQIEDYIKVFGDESIKCEGSVTVTNNNGYYLYTPELDCGEKFSTKTLAKKIIEDNLVESGQGLYEMFNEYVFRGDRINNYATFAGQSWRIISIGEDGNIYLLQEKSNNQCIWDNHYNSEINSLGLNIYYQDGDKPSSLKECLGDLYKETFTEKLRSFIPTQTVCYGARSDSDTSTDSSTECSKTIDNEPVNLIAVYEYLRATIDEECVNIDSGSCNNYNWLADTKATYTITPSTHRSDKVFYKGSGITISSATNYMPVLLKISIDGKINYVSGDGSSEKPYVIGNTTKK